MSTSPELKTCRKGLHQYPVDKKRCPECRHKSARRWDNANREKKRANSLKWQIKNPERSRKNKRKHYLNNLERMRELRRKWRTTHVNETSMHNAKRRAAKKQAIAAWGDENSIKEFYVKRTELTKLTGIQHHVDHIYPLTSDWVCGLHVENNLQILTEAENITKGNRVWPGQLDCQKGSVYAIFPKELTDLLND